MTKRICPMCKKVYEGYPALSRKDNETEICPVCGTREALEAWASTINPSVDEVFGDVMKYFDTGEEAEWMGKTKNPEEKLHGKVVNVWWEPFSNCTAYEDGYVDREYIGD